ncbi:MAG: hypothetical protein PHY24_01060, partial [Candidatus Cloacimonetes bacterium]|nr:hypothetical protein [Candidatus Cloacimonadota bacterium]
MKNSIRIGKPPRTSNRFQTLRLYIVGGSLLIFVFFGIYTQVLIQQAKAEQEYVPRIFAQYIAYTDSYLRAAEKYAQLLTEVSSKYLQFAAQWDFQQQLWDYVSTEFMPDNPIPVIITDEDMQPLVWKNIPVSSDSLYEDLSPNTQFMMGELMTKMIKTALVDDGRLT